jgi:hypothetical protein
MTMKPYQSRESEDDSTCNIMPPLDQPDVAGKVLMSTKRAFIAADSVKTKLSGS